LANEIARKRAKMPESTNIILNQRTLENDHKKLSEFLKPDMFVLDVGCGTGAITYGIAKSVPQGKVIGIDINESLLGEARERYKECAENLFFENQDLYSLPYESQFDIVTSARVLQWLDNPIEGLKALKKAVKHGGMIVILDYNHKKIKWHPKPPDSTLRFYQAFLKWRENAGMDNKIADHLPRMFKDLGFKEIEVSPQLETTRRKDFDFVERIDIWARVAESRGVQMVEDGFIFEDDRIKAIKDYRYWINNYAESQTLYLSCVYGKK
jgi:ubiquinone/menaquinone biosynthesis C-methylase UbiE